MRSKLHSGWNARDMQKAAEHTAAFCIVETGKFLAEDHTRSPSRHGGEGYGRLGKQQVRKSLAT